MTVSDPKAPLRPPDPPLDTSWALSRSLSELSTAVGSLGLSVATDRQRLPEVKGRPDQAGTVFHGTPPTIIVPIFGALPEVSACLASLARHTSNRCSILLIDDGNEPGALPERLEEFTQAHPNAAVVTNPENLGYTASINRGIDAAPSDRDVILLNSDTRVSRGWVEKLRRAAGSRSRVATVTPVSNSAGPFSVPLRDRENAIPEGVSIDRWAALVEELALPVLPEVPTGNGFCMLIRRSAIDQVGRFDEENFPRGYGEENDFCMRASASGFVHVIADDTWIYHRRAASFGVERTALKRAASERLHRLHPNYRAEVERWLSRDPLQASRRRLANFRSSKASSEFSTAARSSEPAAVIPAKAQLRTDLVQLEEALAAERVRGQQFHRRFYTRLSAALLRTSRHDLTLTALELVHEAQSLLERLDQEPLLPSHFAGDEVQG